MMTKTLVKRNGYNLLVDVDSDYFEADKVVYFNAYQDAYGKVTVCGKYASVRFTEKNS